MSSKTTEQRIDEIVVNQLNVNSDMVTPTTNLSDDLGCDSLDRVELIMAIEEEFKHELAKEAFIPESAVENVITVGDLHTAIKGLLK